MTKSTLKNQLLRFISQYKNGVYKQTINAVFSDILGYPEGSISNALFVLCKQQKIYRPKYGMYVVQ